MIAINRRNWLLGALAAGGLLRAGVAQAAPFASRRIAVTVRGTGRDVLLIPGLASGPGIWNGVLAAVPGYRFHLVHVRGFAGLAGEANAGGDALLRLHFSSRGRRIGQALPREAKNGPKQQEMA